MCFVSVFDSLLAVLSLEYSADNFVRSAAALLQAKSVTAADAANRISQAGSASYTFDAHGQTTAKTDTSGTTNYSWDARGRLTGVNLPGSQTVNYAFDALGRRASRSYQGNTTSFVYDGADVVADKVGANVAVDYLNGAGTDEKLRQGAVGNGLYFLTDHLGSTSALTNASGGVVEQLQYEPFGGHSTSSFTRYTYTGREDDAATGLMHYRAREYNPQQGRFMTEDPAGLQGGLNKYA